MLVPSLKYEQTQELFHNHKMHPFLSLFTEKNDRFPYNLVPRALFPGQGRAPWGRGWFPYPFIYLMTEKGTPFWWSLPVKAVIGSNVTAPWDPKAPEAFFLFFHKELRNVHTFLSSLGAVGAVHRLVLVLMHQESRLLPYLKNAEH